MNVSLSAPLEEYINEKVESGMYNSASEVIREGLRSLQENERSKKLDALLIERLERLDNGEKTIPALEVKESILKSLRESSKK